MSHQVGEMTHETHCPFHAVFSDDQILQPCSGCEAIRAAVVEERERWGAALAAIYYEQYMTVAALCDGYLDPTGKMLGVVRDRAAIREQQP